MRGRLARDRGFYRAPLFCAHQAGTRPLTENGRVTAALSSPIDRSLCTSLRGERGSDEPADRDAWLRRARFHGVDALLFHTQQGAPALREAALSFAAWDMRHRALVAAALQALHEAGVPVIVMKGTALACSHYADPALRTRADTDLLVPEESQDHVTRTLEACGFARERGVPTYQSTFTHHAAGGAAHSLDVHWRINNSELLSQLFTHEALWRSSVALPRLSDIARRPRDVDCLLIACMHRATHRHYAYRVDGEAHHDPDRLIWFYDMHLLAMAFDAAAWTEFTDAARSKGLASVALEALRLTREFLGTPIPAHVLERLDVEPWRERAARYLDSRSLSRTWMDLSAMPSWSRRWRWIRERCFPPADYMHAKYPLARIDCLPCLYARRAMAGVWKRLAL